MSLYSCPNCQHPVENREAKHCPHCGWELRITRHRPGEVADVPSQPSETPQQPLPVDDSSFWAQEVFKPVAEPLPPVEEITEELPPWRPAPPRRRRLPPGMLAAICVLAGMVVVAAVVAGVLAARHHSDTTAGVTTTVAVSTSVERETTVTTQPTSTQTAPATTGSSAQTDDWPNLDGWTVIVDSLPVSDQGSQAAARTLVGELRQKGLEAGVLFSSNYTSLNPDYWAVFSGVFQSRAAAVTHQKELVAQGYKAVYAREVRR